MNYKGLHFNNTREDFEQWCNEFPPMDVGKHRKFYSMDGFYMSLEVVSAMGTVFVGSTLREYRNGDFEVVRKELPDKVLEYFDRKYDAYKAKYVG